MMTKTLHFNQGYFKAVDDMIWMLNSWNTCEDSLKKLREQIVSKFLELRPPEISDERRRTSNQ